MGHSVARICARQEPSCEAAEPGECTLQSTVASHHMASSRRACLRGVPIARLLPVLLVLCESNITAETVVPAGTAEGYRPAGALGCRRLGAFLPPSPAGCAHRLEAALMRDSPMILARRVGTHRRGLSLLASHAGGFGARITGGFGDDKTTALHMTKTVTKEKAPSQPALRDVLGDETDSFSAQERRMLGVLSKYGRLHTPESSAGRVGSSPQKSVKSVRVQKEEMAKDRRDEKVALRRRQGSERTEDGAPPKDVAAKTPAASDEGKSNKKFAGQELKAMHGKEGVPLAVKSTDYSHLRGAPGFKGGSHEDEPQPRIKHAAVPTNGKLRRPQKHNKERELVIPHNLANYNSLVELLDVIEPFCGSIGYGMGCKASECCIEAHKLTTSSVSDAVGALNRLKRLGSQASNKHLEARLSACMDCLSAVVMDGMPLLSGKLVSLAVNAVAHTRRHSRLITAAGKRAIEMAQSADVHALDVQAVSVILNGFAKAGLRDVVLFSSMSAVAIRLMETNSSAFGAQSISVIANAFAKVRIADDELFTRLARCAEKVPPADFTPQAIANIANAYARHHVLDLGLLSFLSDVSRRSKPSEWLSRHLALVVNALAKLEHRDDELLGWIAGAVLSRPSSSFDVQAVANVLNGYGKLYGSAIDGKLLSHMATALGDMPPRTLDPQSIASALNALVKTGYEDDERSLIKKLAHVVLHLDPLLFDAQSVSTIFHSFAKLDVEDERLFRRMAMVVGQMEFILEPQSIALIINACAKVDYHDEKLMKHLSRIACSLPADAFTPQHVENILNGFARLNVHDRSIFLYMAEVVRTLAVQDFDSQAVAIIMNSFARIMGQDAVTARIFKYLSHEVLPVLATLDLQATSLSIMLNAFAKAEIRDDEAIARLCSLIVVEDASLLQGGYGIPVKLFDGRHIASVLHAVATLHVERPAVLDELLDHLMTLAPEQQLPEEVAIIAWSVAVLNLKRLDVYEWLMRGLDVHIANLDANFLRQAHQFLLTCELDNFHFPTRLESISGSWRPEGAIAAHALPKVVRDQRAAELKERRVEERKYKALKERSRAHEKQVQLEFGASQHRPSRLQRDVAHVLTEMEIPFIEEYVDQRSGYSLDIILSDMRTAIEVDGPSHYAAGTHSPLGNTNMKHRHLSQLGFDTRILPYWEWDELKTKEQKKEYLRNLLTAVPTSSI